MYELDIGLDIFPNCCYLIIFIFIQLSKMNKKNPLDKIKLGSEKAKNIMTKIQTDVLKVFENYEN